MTRAMQARGESHDRALPGFLGRERSAGSTARATPAGGKARPEEPYYPRADDALYRSVKTVTRWDGPGGVRTRDREEFNSDGSQQEKRTPEILTRTPVSAVKRSLAHPSHRLRKRIHLR